MVRGFGKRVRAMAGDARELVAYRAAVRSGDDAEADRLARSLLERDPSDHALWFDLALSAKRRRNWAEAVALNERALEVMAKVGEGEPAAWNLGIAATALGDWPRARRAWRTFGITVPEGEGAVVMKGLGSVPIRLNPTNSQLGQGSLEIGGAVHSPEVVWAERLSPAHARVVSVPSAKSGHRWGDVVLADGVPTGERFDGQQWVPVFDELALLERSEHSTWAVSVRAPEPGDSEQLTLAADGVGLAAEDWTAGIRVLCEACSEGRPRHRHLNAEPEWSAERDFGLAAPDEASAREVLERWVAVGAGRAYEGLERVR